MILATLWKVTECSKNVLKQTLNTVFHWFTSLHLVNVLSFAKNSLAPCFKYETLLLNC